MQLLHTFRDAHPDFGSSISTTPLTRSRLVAVDEHLVDELGAREALSFLTAQEPLPGFASVYSGHQFGGYTPRLGDGRAALMGEIETEQTESGNLVDLTLKGSGPTPYSRMGDGKAVLRSTVREYLAGIALRGLGIPTTAALGFSMGVGSVQRETLEPEALLLRTSQGHIRFGHFEYFFHTGNTQALETLIRYCAKRFYGKTFPDNSNGLTDASLLLFEQACRRTARLIAQWQTYGFCHGVMNTDNMSIIGETLDFGPFSFMEAFDPGYICNHSDHHGRYAFDQQPSVGLWNLQALAICFSKYVSEEKLIDCLHTYQQEFEETYLSLMAGRLGVGLGSDSAARKDLIKNKVKDFLQILIDYKLDYNNSFLVLSELNTPANSGLSDEERSKRIAADVNAKDAQEIVKKFRDWSSNELSSSQDSVTSSPKVILRNAFCEEIIQQVTSTITGSTSEEESDSASIEAIPELSMLQAALLVPSERVLSESIFSRIPQENIRYPSLSCSS